MKHLNYVKELGAGVSYENIGPARCFLCCYLTWCHAPPEASTMSLHQQLADVHAQAAGRSGELGLLDLAEVMQEGRCTAAVVQDLTPSDKALPPCGSRAVFAFCRHVRNARVTSPQRRSDLSMVQDGKA